MIFMVSLLVLLSCTKQDEPNDKEVEVFLVSKIMRFPRENKIHQEILGCYIIDEMRKKIENELACILYYNSYTNDIKPILKVHETIDKIEADKIQISKTNQLFTQQVSASSCEEKDKFNSILQKDTCSISEKMTMKASELKDQWCILSSKDKTIVVGGYLNNKGKYFHTNPKVVSGYDKI